MSTPAPLTTNAGKERGWLAAFYLNPITLRCRLAIELAPAYQFYVKEWRSSRSVQRMTFAQRGMFLEMLNEQWENLSLPDDPATVADIIGGTVEEWAAAWPVLRRKFVLQRGRKCDQAMIPETHDASRRIVNLKLEEIRSVRRAYRGVARKGGLARGQSAKRGKDGTYLPAGKPAAIQQVSSRPAGVVSSTPSPSPSASPSASPSPSSWAGDARSKRPIVKGQKLTVFEWMHDDAMKILGQFADDFELDRFYDALDKRMFSEHIVQPARDNGEWFRSEVIREAQRRGLPIQIAAAPEAGKQTTRLAAALANIAREG